MIALIKSSTGCLPKIIGKPNREIIDTVFQKLAYRQEELAMVGDRLYTDIATAVNAGITGIVVLSGETKAEDLRYSQIQPDYIFENIAELLNALYYADQQ